MSAEAQEPAAFAPPTNGTGSGTPPWALARPRGRAHGWARIPDLLRQITGVDENLLDEVPTERPRYTRLGGVIVGTASIATLSMWFALSEIVGEAGLFLIVPALLWGLFIGNLDSWLVSGLHGTSWRRHVVGVVVPRLLLAIFFGFLIAEPIVLKAFQPAIEREVGDSRQAYLQDLEARLGRCNPTTGVLRVVRAECANSLVVVHAVSAGSVTQELRDLNDQAARLQHQIDSDAATQRRLDAIARQECNGTSGRGLSGRAGVGVNCIQNRQDAADFSASSPRRQQIAEKVTITRRIAYLTGRQKASAQAYEQAVRDGIAAKVAEARGRQREIGLLERLKALRRLVAGNVSLGVAEWLLRLLFVTIDCLPLIAKLSAGSGSYDHVLDKRLAAVERTFDARQRHDERTATTGLEFELYRLERRLQAEKDTLDSELRLEQARRDIEVDRAIDDFTARLLREEEA